MHKSKAATKQMKEQGMQFHSLFPLRVVNCFLGLSNKSQMKKKKKVPLKYDSLCRAVRLVIAK